MSNKREVATWMEPHRRWDEGDARAALAAHRTSGLSAEAFAREHGFSGQRLRAWGTRLAELSSGEQPQRSALVPVVVREGASVSGTRQRPMGTAVVIRAGNAVIELQDTTSIDAGWLAEFVTAIGGGS